MVILGYGVVKVLIYYIVTDYRGGILTNPPFTLVITREHAYIWDYTSPITVNKPRTFTIPWITRINDPTPLGLLIKNGASTTVGLVLASAVSGDVIYWENIDTAESLSLFQDKSTGVKGTIGSLSSGEIIIDIVCAEHAGILLTLNSGRIIHVNLRDAQGRPVIQSQSLKSKDSSNTGGLFAGIKGALGLGWKKNQLGIRTRSQGSKGLMQVISLTMDAEISVWDLAWSGHCTIRECTSFHSQLVSEIGKFTKGSVRESSEISVVDFAVLQSKPALMNALSLTRDDTPLDLVALVRTGPNYVIVEITLTGSQVYIERISPIKGYSSSTNEKARLILPTPGHSIIVAFKDAIALITMANNDLTDPETQLLMESHSGPEQFQSIIYLKTNQQLSILDIVGEEFDDRNGQSSIIVFIKSFGLARFSAFEPKPGSVLNISAKSLIEQAVFFGTNHNNIIDFNRFDMTVYSQQEIEEAALQISSEILSSESPYLSTTIPSIEVQISDRQQACIALVGFLRRHFAPISRVTNWKLITDTERLAAGLSLWKKYEQSMQDTNLPQPSVLPAVIKVVRNKTRGAKVTKDSEVDEVRHWFIHDLGHLDQLCLQALSLVNNGYQNGALQHLMKLLSECDDIIFSVFEAVSNFRSNYADTYGFNPATLVDGILEEDWQDLPEPWTATHEGLNLLDHYIDIARNYAVDWYEKPETEKGTDELFVDKVVKENLDLVQILCKCYRERIGWCSAHYTEKYRNYAPSLAEKFKRSRDHHLRGLIKIGQAGAGLGLAEKYKDMDSLVRLVMSEASYLTESLAEPDIQREERAVISERMSSLQNNVQRFFKDHGESFANAFFDNHIAGHRSYGLLKEPASFQESLTRYLRAEESRGRMSWVNEVLNTKDFNRASSALRNLAENHETKLWNRKVQFSISKLTALAAVESTNKSQQPSKSSPITTKDLDSALSLIKIQNQVYNHISSLIRTAVDHEAEIQLVSDSYAVSLRTTYPALHSLLESLLDRLLNHIALSPEQLIDLLSLMDNVPSLEVDHDISGREIHLALQILQLIKDNQQIKEEVWMGMLATVWKRCYLSEEWDILSKTGNKSEKKVEAMIKETKTASSIALCFDDGEFEALLGSNNNLTNDFIVLVKDSGVKVLSPKECIAATSTKAFIDHLKQRFTSSTMLDSMMKDIKVQDMKLEEYIKKHELEKWIEACTVEAKKMHEEEQTYRNEEKKALEDAEKKGLDDSNKMGDEDHAKGNSQIHEAEVDNTAEDNEDVSMYDDSTDVNDHKTRNKSGGHVMENDQDQARLPKRYLRSSAPGKKKDAHGTMIDGDDDVEMS